MSFCEDPSFLKILMFGQMIIDFIKIGVPIGLILLGSIDLSRAVIVGKEDEIKKHQSKLVKRSIYAALVFFVPTIVSVLIGYLGQNSIALSTCASNMNIDTVRKLEALEKLKNKDEDKNDGNNGGDNDGDNDSGGTPNSIPVTLTVGTWNIGGGTKYSGITATKLGAIISNNSIDIVGIQEAKGAGGSSRLIQNMLSPANMSYYYYTDTPAGNAILSKTAFLSRSSRTLVSCYERRALQKTVINIGGKNISFYNTHISYQSGCLNKQIKDVINKISNDFNPTILVGDFNVATNCSIILNNLGSKYSFAAYDTYNSSHKCTDSIIISKGSIIVSSIRTIKTDGTLTDHNFVKATLKIY